MKIKIRVSHSTLESFTGAVRSTHYFIVRAAEADFDAHAVGVGDSVPAAIEDFLKKYIHLKTLDDQIKKYDGMVLDSSDWL